MPLTVWKPLSLPALLLSFALCTTDAVVVRRLVEAATSGVSPDSGASNVSADVPLERGCAASDAISISVSGERQAGSGRTHGRRCLAFHSMVKAGSDSVLQLLKHEPICGEPAGTFHHMRCADEHWGTETRQCHPRNVPSPDRQNWYESGAPYAVEGAFALSLYGRPGWSRDTCAWITVIREPIARMVSSYMYCQQTYRDNLCAWNQLSSKEVSFENWARHWGNHLFRDLVLEPELLRAALPPDTGAAAEAAESAAREAQKLKRGKKRFGPPVVCDSLCRIGKRLGAKTPRWYAVKSALAERGGEDLTKAEGKANLERLTLRMRGDARLGVPPLFDVVGLLERWDETCRLFDRVAPLGRLLWKEATSKYASLGHGASGAKKATAKAAQAALLANAINNSVVLESAALDIRIYSDVVVPLFETSLVTHGIATR